ncbi:MAG: NADP-specific glutamate dehydrogenase [Acidimicrobiia bacterium]|nr:NADP-specific glutamate dehydrogenase [Acidimicrobiia bacterium]
MNIELTPTQADRLEAFMEGLQARNPGESEFHQAVGEVATTLMPYLETRPDFVEAKILERMIEPDRIIIFRVTWEDDDGNVQVNRAWRVQFNNSIGAYKGGLRFHPDVTQSVLKFLGFEQILKNSLTDLPMGGAKGGSNFDPKGRSDREVMRFCQSMMTELFRHIGDETDIPAGDIGVGGREISYLFGQYKRLVDKFEGALTGKGLAFGGSAVRVEATGYGAVFFAEAMLKHADRDIRGHRCAVSGSGNVALYAMQKLNDLGAVVLTASDSDGTVFDPAGISGEKWEWLRELKEIRRGRVREYAEHFGCQYLPGERPWSIPCDIALPCSTQNELDGAAAKMLVDNGVVAVVEGANMPSTAEAIERFQEADVLFAPGKAANAGGVAVSGLELSQNAVRLSWSRAEVEARLADIMHTIHRKCVERGTREDGVDYVAGANIAGFEKVAEAMLAYGVM